MPRYKSHRLDTFRGFNKPTDLQPEHVIVKVNPMEVEAAERNPYIEFVAVAHPEAVGSKNDVKSPIDDLTIDHMRTFELKNKPITIDHGDWDFKNNQWIKSPQVIGHVKRATVDEDGRVIIRGMIYQTSHGVLSGKRIAKDLVEDVSMGIHSRYNKKTGDIVHECNHIAICREGRKPKTNIIAYVNHKTGDSFLLKGNNAEYRKNATTLRECMDLRPLSRAELAQCKNMQKNGKRQTQKQKRHDNTMDVEDKAQVGDSSDIMETADCSADGDAMDTDGSSDAFSVSAWETHFTANSADSIGSLDQTTTRRESPLLATILGYHARDSSVLTHPGTLHTYTCTHIFSLNGKNVTNNNSDVNTTPYYILLFCQLHYTSESYYSA